MKVGWGFDLGAGTSAACSETSPGGGSGRPDRGSSWIGDDAGAAGAPPTGIGMGRAPVVRFGRLAGGARYSESTSGRAASPGRSAVRTEGRFGAADEAGAGMCVGDDDWRGGERLPGGSGACRERARDWNRRRDA